MGAINISKGIMGVYHLNTPLNTLALLLNGIFIKTDFDALVQGRRNNSRAGGAEMWKRARALIVTS